MECDPGNAKKNFFIVPEQFADKPHDAVEDHHMGINRAVGFVFLIFQDGLQIHENKQCQNRFHNLCGEMITMGTDIVNTVLPRITGAAAGEYAGKLCQAASDQRVHDNRIAGETAFYPQDQGRDYGKQREEYEQADNAVYGVGNTEEMDISQIPHTGPDDIAHRSRTEIHCCQNDDHFPPRDTNLLTVKQAVQKSNIGCSTVDIAVHIVCQTVFSNFSNQFIHKFRFP